MELRDGVVYRKDGKPYPAQGVALRVVRLKEAGLCIVCGGAKQRPILRCDECARKIQELTTASAERAKAAGLCPRCRKRKAVGAHCRVCRVKVRAEQRALVSRRVAAGVCRCCGADSGGRSRCRRCAERDSRNARDSRRARIEAGRCSKCSRRVAKGSRTECVRHRAERREANRALYRRRRASGDCVSCGRPRGHDGTLVYCRPCAQDAVRRQTRYMRRRRGQAG